MNTPLYDALVLSYLSRKQYSANREFLARDSVVGWAFV